MSDFDGNDGDLSAWPDELENEVLTEERFTEIYAEKLCAKMPEVMIAITDVLELQVDDPEVEGATIEWLGNLWNSCAGMPGQRAAMCETFQNSSIAALRRAREMEQPPALEDVLPVIKHEDMMLARAEQAGTDQALAGEPFIGDLCVFLVADYPESLRYLMQSDLMEMGVTFPDLLQQAQQNLLNNLQVQRLDTDKEVYMLKVDGNYEASLMLLDDVWDRLAATGSLAGDFVVAVPTRDVLLYCGSEAPGMVDVIKNAVNRLFSSETPYLLSRQLYIRHRGQWHVLDPNQPEPPTSDPRNSPALES